MVEDVTSAAQERCGDGFKLYAEIYALRLGFDALDAPDGLEPLEPQAPSGPRPTDGRAGDGAEPPAPGRRAWSRPWR